MDIGLRLQEVRNKKGLSQRELAKRVGVTNSTISFMMPMTLRFTAEKNRLTWVTVISITIWLVRTGPSVRCVFCARSCRPARTPARKCCCTKARRAASSSRAKSS
ncbi:MAG: helix-turn-helix domain-containing protein [Xanthomonadaceae bacterium]|nr:helix-turn-helix domain-containing protein [Xanthomonadaceae bacterium]